VSYCNLYISPKIKELYYFLYNRVVDAANFRKRPLVSLPCLFVVVVMVMCICNNLCLGFFFIHHRAIDGLITCAIMIFMVMQMYPQFYSLTSFFVFP